MKSLQSECLVTKGCSLNLTRVTRFKGPNDPDPMWFGQILGPGSTLSHMNLSILNVLTNTRPNLRGQRGLLGISQQTFVESEERMKTLRSERKEELRK